MIIVYTIYDYMGFKDQSFPSAAGILFVYVQRYTAFVVGVVFLHILAAPHAYRYGLVKVVLLYVRQRVNIQTRCVFTLVACARAYIP
jgi:hypothetical protein